MKDLPFDLKNIIKKREKCILILITYKMSALKFYLFCKLGLTNLRVKLIFCQILL
ncbi:hypothetical protein KL86DYS2_11776 [uncultured Dysgonomonas sp.]|uniref:Uncharacterized protein n=1 Tax=uncultured Dysgonomonas sp. TaxID=206096 RepID=A0A212JKT1_9BACT|nr:hypothetical protein KL86DYS2_11776 [uncultured Dysgonomonas sp.]